MFSYVRNSCSRNHRRFTLCGAHFAEGHPGDWKKCKKCFHDFEHELEMYVWYGTNEYNFTKLENPPKYEPTHCESCAAVIILSEGGYSTYAGRYYCKACSAEQRAEQEKEFKTKNQENTLTSKEILAERDKILKYREILEYEIELFLKKSNQGLTLAKIKRAIYLEKDTGAIMDIIKMFYGKDLDFSGSKSDQTLRLANDAWNYFPHKTLGGLSPAEKFLEYRKVREE